MIYKQFCMTYFGHTILMKEDSNFHTFKGQSHGNF
jgi:hypothetical protein